MGIEDTEMRKFASYVMEYDLVLHKITEFIEHLKQVTVPLERYSFFIVHVIPYLEQHSHVIGLFNCYSFDKVLELLRSL